MLKLYIILSLLFVLGFAQDDQNITTTQNETITKLDLSNKELASLDEYDFSSYPLLKEIDLSNNNLVHIKEKTFVKNEKLVKINLSGNKKLVLPKFSTLLISTAEELDLSNCNIQKLYQNVFDGLRYLKTIDLSNNPIKKKGFPVRAFYTIESLQKIILPKVATRVLKELCKELNVTAEVKIDEVVKTVECKDYPIDKDDEDDDENEPEVVEIEGQEKKTNETSDDSQKVENPPAVVNEKPHLEPRTDNETETNKTVNNTVAIEASIDLQPEKPHLEPRANETQAVIVKEDAAKKENANETINNSNVIQQVKSPIISVDKPADQKANPNLKEQNSNAEPGAKVSENMVDITGAKDNESAKVGEVTETSNTGSTILIVLVIAVVIAGVAAFGYKFYKNRTQQTLEPVERELKEIVATKPVGEDSIRDVTEQEPLMNNHVHKENGDPKPNQSQIVSNNLSMGPYQPTTTTFKPIDENGK